MEIKKLLPIGSVVMLNDAQKRIMVIGVKQYNEEDGIEYDYMGVLYPEGYMGEETMFLFNHADIDKYYYRGYEDVERYEFLESLEEYYSTEHSEDEE